MTEGDWEEQFLFDMKQALKDAQARKWLGRERHGYCFSCGQEKIVFDIIAEESPVQPPKCEDCFVEGAIAFLENPQAEQIIKEFLENEPEGPE